jgi:hypothetical protein
MDKSKDTDNLEETPEPQPLCAKAAPVAEEPVQADASNNNVQNQKQQQQYEPEKSIRLVIQRFRKASLLIDESEMVTVGSNNSDDAFSGILVYTSFAKSATKEKVLHAAKTVMNLPILTRGLWGDGSEPISVLEMAKEGGVAVMLVPQANLISKVSAA